MAESLLEREMRKMRKEIMQETKELMTQVVREAGEEIRQEVRSEIRKEADAIRAQMIQQYEAQRRGISKEIKNEVGRRMDELRFSSKKTVAFSSLTNCQQVESEIRKRLLQGTTAADGNNEAQIVSVPKEMTQGRNELMGFNSQPEHNGEEARNSMLCDGESELIRVQNRPDAIVEDRTEMESPQEETIQERNELFGLLSSQQEENGEETRTTSKTEATSSPEAIIAGEEGNAKSNIIWRCLHRGSRLFGAGGFSSTKDPSTGTIGLYAVSVVVDSSVNTLQAWITAAGVLAFVLFQIFVMTLVINDLISPNDYNDVDCGAYVQAKQHVFENIGCNVTYYDYKCLTTDGEVKDNYGYNITDNDDVCLMKDIEVIETENKDRCIINTGGLKNKSLFFLMAFLSLLWMLPIIKDIEEANTEERIMNHHLKNTLKGPAEVLRMSFRIRTYMLPFFITAATIILILSEEEIDSKSILLNFLAISYISEADNIIAILFLGTEQYAMMKNVVNNIDIDLSNARPEFLWNRVQGFLCAVLLCVSMALIEKSNTENCIDLGYWLLFCVLLFPSIIITFIHFCYNLCCSRKNNETSCKKFLYSFTDFSYNMLSCGMGLLPFCIVDTGGEMIWIIVPWMVVCLPLFIVLLLIKRKKFGAEEISESSDMV